MATDLEPGTDPGEPATARPSLKITGLHIRGLKSIGSLDLPGDGLGWDGPIPDFLMVGGINGSGKSTLLEFLASVFDQHGGYDPRQLVTVNAWIDFKIESPGFEQASVRYLIGNKEFIQRHRTEGNWYGRLVGPAGFGSKNLLPSDLSVDDRLLGPILRNQILIDRNAPGVVYIPSEGRTLVVPETTYKMPGDLTPSDKFVQRWQRPEQWNDSLPALLYALRWEDLNAKEEGRPEDATHFRSYQVAVERFFEGRKRLRWTPKGELVVETKSGDIHDLSELSSGEKQVILFMGELLHRWRPGSLILIDEPELHLHEHYQTRLWQALLAWQEERGGQVIVATQSDHLFGISDPGIKVLLSAGRAR